MTQQEAADFLGISWGQYRNYEYRPDQPIPAEVLAKITALGYLSLTGSRLMPVTAQAYGTLKVYGAVSAGASGVSAPFDEYEVTVPIEFMRPGYGGLRAENDSMMPYIQPRDTLIFKDYIKPLSRRAFVAISPECDTPIVKETTWTKGEWSLTSWNPTYEPMSMSDVQLQGYLVGIVSNDGGFKLGPDDDGLTREKIESYLRSRLF